VNAQLPAAIPTPEAPSPTIDNLPAPLARIAELETLLAAEREKNRQLEKRLKELEMRLGMNSDNSSKPPSIDPP